MKMTTRHNKQAQGRNLSAIFVCFHGFERLQMVFKYLILDVIRRVEERTGNIGL